MAAELLLFRVRFPAEPDLTVSTTSADTISVIINEVRKHKQVALDKHVRVICGGKELYPDDLVTKASGRVLHCMVTDVQPQRPAQPKKPPPPPPPPVVEQQPVDWLDVVDPGTVLMWIFGSILALLWLLFVFYAHMYDRTSVVMLCMMTVAFLIPCVLSYLPWPSFLQAQQSQQPAVLMQPLGSAGPYPAHDPYGPTAATGRSTGVHHAADALRQRVMPPGAVLGSDPIPPRPAAPQARVRQ